MCTSSLIKYLAASISPPRARRASSALNRVRQRDCQATRRSPNRCVPPTLRPSDPTRPALSARCPRAPLRLGPHRINPRQGQAQARRPPVFPYCRRRPGPGPGPGAASHDSAPGSGLFARRWPKKMTASPSGRLHPTLGSSHPRRPSPDPDPDLAAPPYTYTPAPELDAASGPVRFLSTPFETETERPLSGAHPGASSRAGNTAGVGGPDDTVRERSRKRRRPPRERQPWEACDPSAAPRRGLCRPPARAGSRVQRGGSGAVGGVALTLPARAAWPRGRRHLTERTVFSSRREPVNFIFAVFYFPVCFPARLLHPSIYLPLYQCMSTSLYPAGVSAKAGNQLYFSDAR
jgi:hypothetical protein